METLFEFAAKGMRAQAAVDKLCQQPLAHTNDPLASFEAGQKVVESGALSKQEQQVYAEIVLYEERIRFLKNYKHKGVTAKELAKWSGLNYWVIQRRLSGLRTKGKIERTGDIRDGSNAWRLLKKER